MDPEGSWFDEQHTGNPFAMRIGVPLGIVLGVVGLVALTLAPGVGAATLAVAFVAVVFAVFRSGQHADGLPGEDPPETMARMRGPGI
jgi:hypothetical protein